MKSIHLRVGLAVVMIAAAGRTQTSPTPEKRTNVTGAFEGWFKNPDGTFSLLLGYYNRDNKEVDVPVGPDNRIEPGGPDLGQPTHFYPQRQWGMFAIKVPANFGQKKFTWSITVNGKTSVVPASLLPDYEISPFREEAVGNTPPVLSFDENGPSVQGPLGLTVSRTATVGQPVALTVWVSDDEKFTSLSGARPKSIPNPVQMHWMKYRGPGDVAFEPSPRPPVEKTPARNGAVYSGKSTVSLKFSAPGDYIVHAVANDTSGDGGGGEQCCWTFGDVKVTVKP